MRKYGREDVDYESFYSQWMKYLARRYTLAELSAMRDRKQKEARKASAAHLRSIQRTASMAGNSAARAASRNVVSAAGDACIALDCAIEIHELFPEFAKQSN